ncbi:MAG: galactose mutarotase [Muribaculaceae bacterium]|nr:galactose mutarotase [Muribaculaceae bacterium]
MTKTVKILLAGAASCLALTCCKPAQPTDTLTKSGLDAAKFASDEKGTPTALYTLSNASGAEVCVTNYGGRVVSISVPDRDGKATDVVLGFDSVAAYYPEVNKSDFGAAIGRYANRIADGRFSLDGVDYDLPRNNFGHCLHGGTDMGTLGWQYRIYNVESLTDSTLVLCIDSHDGDNGFPGRVLAKVSYTLTADNALDIAYEATSDAPTIVNITNHTYFNLSGNPENSITNDVLSINASAFTPVDSTFMTTGEILPVENTPMDFRSAKVIGADIERVDYEQIKNANGYDHNWVLDTKGDIEVEAATLYSPASGIMLTMYTDEPGVQVYTGNFLDGTVTGKHGIVYNSRSGICLETQHYPDSPNKPEWPSTVLRPGEKYSSRTIYRFSVK